MGVFVDSSQSFKDLYLQHLTYIDRMVAHLAGRCSLTLEEKEDFGSALHVKLMDRDYESLRRFKGECGFKSYLATVIANFFKDYRNKELGKWRPSASARRLGSAATTLERLTHRDGYTLQEAINFMLVDPNVHESEKELTLLFEKLPLRAPRAQMVGNPSEIIPDQNPDPAASMMEKERDVLRSNAVSAVKRFMDDLDPSERILVNMHYREDVKVSRIARALGLDQRKLYRRMDVIRDTLKTMLQKWGLKEDDLGDLF